MSKKLLKTMRVLLVAAGLCVGANETWAYDTPDGYKVGTVYLGHEVNNQVLAETFANYALNTNLTSLSANWSTNVSGTAGYYWAKINNAVKTVAYPATNQATLYTCNKYSATNDGGTTTKDIYSTDGVTYYTSRDLQTVFDATGYEITPNGTAYQVPSYVYGKCISVQHRSSIAPYLDYTLPSSVSTGKLVFGADFYRIQNANAPVYIQFYDSEGNRVFQIWYQNGDNRRNMYYQVGTETSVAGAGYSEYRTYRGWGIKDMVFDMDAGTVSYTVDNVHSDSKTEPNRRKVSQSAINFGTGKNIAKIRFISDAGASKTNYDIFIDNMYLYTLIPGTTTASDMTIIGTKDYEDGYLASTSSDYTITPNGKLHLQFKNYGSGAYNWNNWIALFTNADKSSNLAFVRADAWELVSSSNTGITTSSNYWDAFEGDMYGSTVVMDITRTDDNVNMVAAITTTADEEMTLTFNKAIGTASEDIVFRLSEEAACLVLDNTKSALVAPPTFTQTGITNTGNPIITVSESTMVGNTTASYYTTDGETPTISSSVYAEPTTVTGGNTIKAITVATASDGTTTLTSNVGSLTTTEYVNGQTYDFSTATESDINSEGFSNKRTGIDYGISSTSRFYKGSDASATLTILDGLTLSGGSYNTSWYWMLGQGLWQNSTSGARNVALSNTMEGEVALFTIYDCRHDGSSWTPSESEIYKTNSTYSLSKSNNTGSEGNHVYMVKKVQSFVPAGTKVSVGAAAGKEFATFNSDYALDFTGISDITAYTAVVKNDGSSVTFTKVTGAVPANTGLLIRAASLGGSADIPVVSEAVAPTANEFVAVTAAAGVDITTGYVLGTKSGVQGFYKANSTDGTHIGKGKAYLPATGAGARLTMVFEDETTGISSVDNSLFTIDNSCYDLQGRRVNVPQKGLYIVNGKKVIIK